ncbi:MAG: energy transducer TonB, partial [Candidatus Angelobacter sp.]
FWLRDLVTALFDPLPMLEQLKRFHGVINLPTDSSRSNACLNMNVPSGVPPVSGIIAYSFCFQGRIGRVLSVTTPGYRANFEDYRQFKNKWVARRTTFSPDPQTSIEAHITELAEITTPDETLLAVDKPTPAAAQLKNIQIGEPTARNILLNSPKVEWPDVREGKTTGIISLYVSADKNGRVREVWPLSSGNPELTATAQAQVGKWQFKPYVNGVPMQMESVLTLAFEAKQGPPVPVLTDAEARKLATRIVAPRLPAHATRSGSFTLRAVVDEQGKLLEVRNTGHVKPVLFQAGERALRQWQFHPYLQGGKPDRFYADITFSAR